jgi:hypothetical protein
MAVRQFKETSFQLHGVNFQSTDRKERWAPVVLSLESLRELGEVQDHQRRLIPLLLEWTLCP